MPQNLYVFLTSSSMYNFSAGGVNKITFKNKPQWIFTMNTIYIQENEQKVLVIKKRTQYKNIAEKSVN